MVKHTSHDLLIKAASTLRNAGVESPVLNAELMLTRTAGVSREKLLTHPELEISTASSKLFLQWVSRREKREPLAYIIGDREFYDLKFEVNPSVLIPRQETEILVEAAIRILEERSRPVAADIGVGSGAIAITIAHKVPKAIIYGTDTSSKALETAYRNARLAGVEDRIHLLEGDMFQPLSETKFDMIVSNPPYIPTDVIETLQPEISVYEPRIALDGGSDGLDQIRRIVSRAPERLMEGGVLAIEVGAGQAFRVQELFIVHGFDQVHAIRDLNHIERVIIGEKHENNCCKSQS